MVSSKLNFPLSISCKIATATKTFPADAVANLVFSLLGILFDKSA